MDGSGMQSGSIYLCSGCHKPIFFDDQWVPHPSPALGRAVAHLPPNVEAVYEEARRCTSQRCFTAAVLLCRKLLMNLAAEHGAPEGKTFVDYINHLQAQNCLPPNGREWADKIRTIGNEATHSISPKSEDEAKVLLTFSEMLLRFLYEYPAQFKSPNDQ